MSEKKINMQHNLELLMELAKKDIKIRYRGAVLGVVWAVAYPLLQMVVLGSILSVFIKIENYFLFLFTGLLPWTFFSQSVSRTTTSIVSERSLVKKSKIPLELIPLSLVLSNFSNLLISVFLLIVFLNFIGNLTLVGFALVLAGIVWLLFFTVGLCLFTSALYVNYRDVSFLVSAVLMLWFYLTPVSYDMTVIPKDLHGVFIFNPLTSIFEILHKGFLGRGIIWREVLLINLFSSIVVFFVGVFIFKKQSKYFVDKI